MITRIYYFANSLNKPAISWFLKTNETKLQNFTSEMKKSPCFKDLYHLDFFNKELEKQTFDLTFSIAHTNNLKEEKFQIQLFSPGVYCIFRKNCYKITNHPLIFQKEDDKSFIFFTDLDDTLLGNDEYLQEFYEYWIQNCLFDPIKKLIYATGRSYRTFCLLEEEMDIFYPEYLICSNGTEIYEYNENLNDYELDSEWDKNIMIDWDPEVVLSELMKIQWLAPNYDSPHDSKALRFLADIENLKEKQQELNEIIKKLEKKQIFISVYYSGHDKHKNVDVNARRAGKGNASVYLMNKLNLKNESTFGFGDSNNDIDLIKKCGKGVLVKNSQKELIDFYTKNKSLEGNIKISEFTYAKALLEELKIILKLNKK